MNIILESIREIQFKEGLDEVMLSNKGRVMSVERKIDEEIQSDKARRKQTERRTEWSRYAERYGECYKERIPTMTVKLALIKASF